MKNVVTNKIDRFRASRRALDAYLDREDGGIALSTAIVMVPLMMAAAVAIDFSELHRARANYQSAADAATLHVAKLITTGTEVSTATDAGRAMFDRNMENIGYSDATITFDTKSTCTSDPVVASVDARHPVFFSGIHNIFGHRASHNAAAGSGSSDGVDEATRSPDGYRRVAMDLEAQVKCANDTLEIALVMDNSGSMSRSGRMATMKSASKELVRDIHKAMKDSPKDDALQFSLVPFSTFVNVGPNNDTQPWMDAKGISPVHHQDLDWSHWPNGGTRRADGRWVDDAGNDLTRFTLYDSLLDSGGSSISWAGCVQMRPYPHHTTDAAPNEDKSETLFVPSFAPDQPDRLTGQRYQQYVPGEPVTHCVQWYYAPYQSYCYRWSDGVYHWNHPTEGLANRAGGDYDANGVYIGRLNEADVLETSNENISEVTYYDNYIWDGRNMPSNLCQGLITHRDCAGSDKGLWQGQHSRHRWAQKYQGAKIRAGFQGPNQECRTQPITPLTTSKTTVETRIDAMQPTDFTNVTMGIGWGWRTLSQGAPFSEGRSKDDKENRKIMIVLTDGEHVLRSRSDPNRSRYSGFGLGVHDEFG